MTESLDAARLAIARFNPSGEDGPIRAMRHAARTSAEKLRCARVGVWLFADEAERSIVSPLVFDARRGEYDEDPQTLSEEVCPSYFAAIRGRRVVAVADVSVDPITAELRGSYLAPRGIRSLLDVPIYRSGEVIGVLCHEDSSPRHWSEDERAFATSVADMLAVVFESERRLECERELHASQRQASEARQSEVIARVAGSLGHDLNNLLAVVLAATESLPRSAEDTKQVIRGAAKRGADLARELLQLGRGEEGASSAPAAISVVLNGVRPLLEHVVSPCELVWEVESGGARVVADAQELERIVVNLVVNAREALPTHGRVRLRTVVDATRVRISVSDNGTGMSSSVAERIFDPFYSTKPRGTGLGLSIVKAIVARRGGNVTLETREGAGTTFHVELPLVAPITDLRSP